MKKNKMMRMASALLVATLLSTSVIAGTFAKYTTSTESTDSARVAKWGVSITMKDDNSAFSSTYKKDDTTETTSSITNSVEAKAGTDSNKDMVVAPGTTGSTEFNVKGTPEVAFKLAVDVSVTSTIKLSANTDYTLAAGEFADAAVKVKPTKDYEPIVFTLEKKSGDTYTAVEGGSNLTLSALESKLEGLSKSYAPNESVDDTYKITWTWPMTTTYSSYTNADGYNTYENADVLDTVIGNQESPQTEGYTITITATQID